MNITTVSLIITYVSACVPWAFVVLYHVLTGGAWRFDRMGWHVMCLTLVDALIFTMLTLADVYPWLAAIRWYQWLYVCVVAGIPAVTLWRAWILWRLYRQR